MLGSRAPARQPKNARLVAVKAPVSAGAEATDKMAASPDGIGGTLRPMSFVGASTPAPEGGTAPKW
jgi:hypothetical protein